ncbi:MAG: hypothetical protein AAGA54_09235 [Myxococcota bacterium]
MDLAPTAATALHLLQRAATATARGVAWLGRAAVRHRVVLLALFVRVAWFASLWIAVHGAASLFDVRVAVDVDATLTQFAAGLGLCWLVVVLAPERRLRWAAVALGTLHGGLGLLLWTVTGGTLPS